MSTRLFALLFTALFIIGALPVLFVQPFGSASAGITAGFMLPAQDIYDAAFLIAVGLLSTWAGNRAILLLPLCALLMTLVGGLMEINEHTFPAVHSFIIGAIILFSLCVSMLRNTSTLLAIPPIAAFAYFVNGGFMENLPPVSTPLFFLMGIIVCSVLILAIGVALGITLVDRVNESMEKFKNMPAFTTFLSFF